MSIGLDPRDSRYYHLLLARVTGNESDGQVASFEGYYGDVRALYGALAADGYPICGRCGLLHPDEDHTHGGRQRRSLKVKGKVEELPPAENAIHLFHETIGKLRRSLAWLPKRREYLKGRRFIAHHELRGELGESILIYERKHFTPERWRMWCETRSLDPEAESHQIPHDFDAPLAVPKDSPAWPLPALIAAYVLADGDVEDLVEVLHPDPDLVDRGKLRKEIEGPEGLVRHAQRVAALVRGGSAGPGRRAKDGISADERRVAAHLKVMQARGCTDEGIVEYLNDGGSSLLPEGFTPSLEEVKRLTDFDLD